MILEFLSKKKRPSSIYFNFFVHFEVPQGLSEAPISHRRVTPGVSYHFWKHLVPLIAHANSYQYKNIICVVKFSKVCPTKALSLA